MSVLSSIVPVSAHQSHLTTQFKLCRSHDDSSAPAFFKTPSAPTRIDSVGLPAPATTGDLDEGDVWDSNSFLVAAAPVTTEAAASTEQLWAMLLYSALALDALSAVLVASPVLALDFGPPIGRRVGDAYSAYAATQEHRAEREMNSVWRSLTSVYGWPPLLAPGQLGPVSPGTDSAVGQVGVPRGQVGPPDAQPPLTGGRAWTVTAYGRLFGTVTLVLFGAFSALLRPTARERAAVWAWLVEHGPRMRLWTTGKQGQGTESGWPVQRGQPSGRESLSASRSMPWPLLLIAVRLTLLPAFIAMLWVVALLAVTGVWPSAGVVAGTLNTPAVTYAASGAPEYYLALLQLVSHMVCAWCAHRLFTHGGPLWFHAGGSLSSYC